MKILNIIYLNEGREDYALQTFGTTIENRMKSDHSNKLNSPKNVIAEFNRIDPKSLVWLCRMYCSHDFLIEDIPRLKDIIKSFYTNRSKLQVKDINQYKQVSDLEDAVEAVADALPASVDSRKAPASGEYVILINEGDFKVLSPKTKAASQYFGARTKWCTARTDNGCMFDSYNEDGSLYIIIDGTEKYQYHFGDNSFTFMDAKDNTVCFFEIEKLLKKSVKFEKMFKAQVVQLSEQYEGQSGHIYGPLYHVAKILSDSNSVSSEDYIQTLNFLEFIFNIPLTFDEVDLKKLNADCRFDIFFNDLPEIFTQILDSRSREVYDILVSTGNVVGAVKMYRDLSDVSDRDMVGFILDNYSKLGKFNANNPRSFQKTVEQVFSRYMEQEPQHILTTLKRFESLDGTLLGTITPYLIKAAKYYQELYSSGSRNEIYGNVLAYLGAIE